MIWGIIIAFRVWEKTDHSVSIVNTRSKGIKTIFAYVHSVQVCMQVCMLHMPSVWWGQYALVGSYHLNKTLQSLGSVVALIMGIRMIQNLFWNRQK